MKSSVRLGLVQLSDYLETQMGEHRKQIRFEYFYSNISKWTQLYCHDRLELYNETEFYPSKHDLSEFLIDVYSWGEWCEDNIDSTKNDKYVWITRDEIIGLLTATALRCM